MSELRIARIIIERQLKLSWINKFLHLNSLVFYIICIAVFNIAIGPYQLDEAVKIGLLFTPLVLSMMLNATTIAHEDYKNGILQQLVLLPNSLDMIIIGKFFGHFLTYLPVVLLTIPVGCVILDVSVSQIAYLTLTAITLVFFTLGILLLSSIMTLGFNFNILLPILVLPLIIPALIFCTLAYNDSAYLWLLIAINFLLLPINIFLSKHLLVEQINSD